MISDIEEHNCQLNHKELSIIIILSLYNIIKISTMEKLQRKDYYNIIEVHIVHSRGIVHRLEI